MDLKHWRNGALQNQEPLLLSEGSRMHWLWGRNKIRIQIGQEAQYILGDRMLRNQGGALVLSLTVLFAGGWIARHGLVSVREFWGKSSHNRFINCSISSFSYHFFHKEGIWLPSCGEEGNTDFGYKWLMIIFIRL